MWASRKLNGTIRTGALWDLTIRKHRKCNKNGYDHKTRQQYCRIISPSHRCGRSTNSSQNLTIYIIYIFLYIKTEVGTFQISRIPTDLWNEAGVVSGNIGCVQRAKCPSQGSQILQIGLWPYQLETPHPNILTRKSQLFDYPTSFETGNGRCVHPLREKETLQD